MNLILVRGLSAIFLLLFLHVHGNAYYPPSADEIQRWARERAPRHTGLRDKMFELDDSYEIVFIPGILGSKLKIGDFTYGDDPLRQASWFLIVIRRPFQTC
jgi:hypothetical protein